MTTESEHIHRPLISALKTTVPQLAHAALQRYEDLPPLEKLGVDAAIAFGVERAITSIELRHRLNASGALQEISDEVHGLDTQYAAHLGNEVVRADTYVQTVNEKFAHDKTFQAIQKFLSSSDTDKKRKPVVTNEQLTSAAQTLLNEEVTGELDQVSTTLAEISHADKYMSPAHASIQALHHGTTGQLAQVIGGELLGAELHVPTAVRVGNTILSGARRGLTQAHELSTKEIKKITKNSLTRLILHTAEIEIPPSDNTAVLRGLMIKLEKAEIIHHVKGSRRGNPVYSDADRKSVIAAVELAALQLAQSSSSSTNDEMQLIRKADLVTFLASQNVNIQKRAQNDQAATS